MKDLKVMDSVKNVVSTMEGIIKVVADYNNGKGAMGYSYFYYATAMYNLIDENSENGIRLLGVNGVKPTYESIKNGSYPIQTAYYIVINKNEPKDSDTRKLVDAMLSARGQNVAKEAGYVPVK